MLRSGRDTRARAGVRIMFTLLPAVVMASRRSLWGRACLGAVTIGRVSAKLGTLCSLLTHMFLAIATRNFAASTNTLSLADGESCKSKARGHGNGGCTQIV